MKSLRFILLSASILMICGFGDTLFALTATNGFSQGLPIFSGTIVLAIIGVLCGYKFFKREQKARVLIPIKTQRPENPTVIRRKQKW